MSAKPEDAEPDLSDVCSAARAPSKQCLPVLYNFDVLFVQTGVVTKYKAAADVCNRAFLT